MSKLVEMKLVIWAPANSIKWLPSRPGLLIRANGGGDPAGSPTDVDTSMLAAASGTIVDRDSHS